MNEFQQKAEQIGRAFKTDVSSQWVVSTGRRDLVNGLLNEMRAAQSPSGFESAAYNFKRQVLLPYFREVVASLPKWQHEEFIKRNPLIAMKPRKPLGSWDELRKDPAFSETQYRSRAVPPDTTRHPQLMRIVNDPVESEMAARQLGVTPEELRAHVQSEWQKRAKKTFLEDMASVAAQGQAYRDSLAKDYEDSWTGTVLGALAPEVTGYQTEAIRTGNEDGWKLAKAIAKDALVNVGSLYTGGAAGAIAKHPAARALVQGGLDAGIEAGRQAASDYYDFDPANVAAVGGVSAGFPALLGGIAGMASQLPATRRIVRPVLRKLRGMVVDPAVEEAERAAEIQRRAAAAIEASESGTPLAREGATDAIEDMRPFLEGSPARVYDQSSLTRDDIRDILMDPELSKKYFEPPSADEFSENIVQRDASGPKDFVDVGGQQRLASDVSEDWLNRAKKQWPENYKSVSTPEPKPTLLDRIGGWIVDAGSREETLRRRAKGEKKKSTKPSRGLEDLMKNDPELIRMWEAGFAPHGNDAAAALYKEWQEKFRR